MSTHGKLWLVIAAINNYGGPDEAILLSVDIIGVGCVRAESEQEAFDEGRELLGVEVTQAIPLAEIEAGWILGEGK